MSCFVHHVNILPVSIHCRLSSYVFMWLACIFSWMFLFVGLTTISIDYMSCVCWIATTSDKVIGYIYNFGSLFIGYIFIWSCCCYGLWFWVMAYIFMGSCITSIFSWSFTLLIIYSVDPKAKWLCIHLDLWINGCILCSWG